jgi:hypothetical protein
MNTNDIERQLETLAANAANPEMPLAILDRMAQLEAGTSTAGQSEANVVRLPRLRLGATSRSRGLTLLGVAAILALVGGVMSVSGSHPVQATPAPTQSWSPPPSLRVSPVQPTTALKTPASLGPWRQIYTFGSEFTFGHIWGGGPFQPVWLSWQDNEIIGLATRYRAPKAQQICVLQSKDGTDWTCAELPTPTGEACGPGPCPEVTGLAVHNGRWVVVGYSSFKSPSLGVESSDRLTLLTWTSDDGTNWSVQPNAPSPSDFITGTIVMGDPTPPALLATGNGFLMSGCPNGNQPALRTSTDGTSWKPVTFAPGSMTMTCAHLGAGSPAGYMASGSCWNDVIPSIECVAFSPDGLTWTTSNPTAGAPGLPGSLRLAGPDGPTYVDGQWVLPLYNGYNYYQGSSPDGINWTVSQAVPADFLSTEPGLSESDYHPPVFSQLASAGYWGLNDGPRRFDDPASAAGYSLVPAGAGIYWSASGIQWRPVSNAPPGWPTDVVETPTSLIAFMTVEPGSASSPVTSVWIADKR